MYVNINQDIRHIQPKLSISVCNNTTEQIKQSFDATLTVERMKQRITIDELSMSTKIPTNILKDYESGKRKPDMCALGLLQKYLNVSLI